MDRLAARVLSRFNWFFRPFEALADQTPMPARLTLADMSLAVVVAGLAALVAAWSTTMLGQTFLNLETINVWFDADTPRVFDNLLSPKGSHTRTSVHPIASLLLTPIGYALHNLIGLPKPLSAQIIVIASAAGMAGFYALALRLMGLGRFAVVAFSALFIASAAFLHWGGTVELFASSGFTIMLTIAGLAAGRRLGKKAWVIVAAVSLSMTVTNVMAGIAAALVRWKRLPFIKIMAAAVIAVMALSLVQKATFSRAALFFDPRKIAAEQEWTQPAMEQKGDAATRWGLADNLRSVWMTTIVAPPPYLDVGPDGKILRVSNQELQWAKVSPATMGAMLGWAALLILGLWGAFRPGPQRGMAVAVSLMMAGQTLLHAVYGYPTFLYSAHFLPILMTLAALAWFTPMRRVLPLLVLLVAGLAAVSNSGNFLQATELQREAIGARQERLAVLVQMERRHDDPWPRGTGHVPLGRPGDPDETKGWIEPGGSFSPAFDSFGLSFWVVGRDGGPDSTSDSIALKQTKARYLDPASAEPGMLIDTPDWQAQWRVVGGNGYDLTLQNRTQTARRIDIVVRSVGPAGGRLDRATVDGNAIRLPDGWTLEPADGALVVRLGIEGTPEWTRAQPAATNMRSIEDRNGWAYVRLVGAAPGQTAHFRLRRATQLADPGLPIAAGPRLEGFDPAFSQALDAHIATLRIGLSDRQTRPGDPINYPLQWLRDGAYVVVALARAGQIELAQDVALAAAPTDFFGGFGAEADAPGIGLWMLAEVSALSGSSAFDRAIWPHVVRKVRIIEDMLDTRADIRAPFSGPMVPSYAGHPEADLVAEPARDGLINGRMDWNRPVFFVNAVTHAGLVGAAQIADRLGNEPEAIAWRLRAAALGTAWNRALVDPAYAPQAANERTPIAGRWVGEIADPIAYSALLEQRWPQLQASFDNAEAKAPLWTYFTLAEVHQHLRLGHPERARKAFAFFAAHQPAPGLYSLWEGAGEENSFGLWARTRGWVRPAHVTPHYWAAAEMLLLQMSMLAYRERDTLVIGAGLAPEQLRSRLTVAGVGVAGASVDWAWSAGTLDVTIHGAGRDLVVRPGPAFPRDTVINVRQQAA